jgi:hypothetical protein
MVMGPWTPIFRGVDYAVGTNFPQTPGIPRLQVVNVMRLDLSDPDLRLFTDPPCTNCGGQSMTRGDTTSGFLRTNGLQGAINYSFYSECCNYAVGTAMHPFGLAISQGRLASTNWTPTAVESGGRKFFTVLLFTTNNAPILIASNYPPTNLAGIYTALAGNAPLLTNGVPLNLDTSVDPRTALGISQDRRYLFLMVIDGRQTGYSDGATHGDLALWLLACGAWDALNVDGGGSTSMVREGCPGTAVQLDRPYHNDVVGTERVTADHFGFWAKPLPGSETVAGQFFGVTNTWKYSNANLDGQSWKSPGYDDSSWPAGPGLLWVDSTTPGGNAYVAPKNTEMPYNTSTGYPYRTYYFRAHFTNPYSPAGMTLIFSNFVDDGAIFYLNGGEIFRTHLSPAPTIYSNASLAAGYSCSNSPTSSGNAGTNCGETVCVSGSILTNLLQGDNVLAVEVHNYSSGSPDITFGSALYCQRWFLDRVTVAPGITNATVSWVTASKTGAQIQYGLTAALGDATAVDPGLAASHTMTLTGLWPSTTYYFRIIAMAGVNQYIREGSFTTLPRVRPLLDLASSWRYTTNNLDGQAWQSRGYDDSGWMGAGPALLGVEDNPSVGPINTALPGTPASLPPTYYFRTTFFFTNNPAGGALLFSNYVDDGAVFYLNGKEMSRVRMAAAPQPVTYTALATGSPPGTNGDATGPDLFQVSGDLMTNLVVGTNVLAAEVHQATAESTDIVFGSAVFFLPALVTETRLSGQRSNNVAWISWEGRGFTLQSTSGLGGTNTWSDVPGSAQTSPYVVTNPPAAIFYRLRQ